MFVVIFSFTSHSFDILSIDVDLRLISYEIYDKYTMERLTDDGNGNILGNQMASRCQLTIYPFTSYSITSRPMVTSIDGRMGDPIHWNSITCNICISKFQSPVIDLVEARG